MIDAGERGSLTIAPKVVEKVAKFASREVWGVTGGGGNISHALGRSYPHIHAEIAGGRAVLDIEVAAVWPTPLPELATEVARSVRAQVSRCAGVQIDRINVLVGHVIKKGTATDRRVQ